MTEPLDLAPLTADALASDPLLVDKLADGEHPLALLPVRLETRYRTDANGTELLVRVYPDQVHVDAHDPRLSAAEIAAGQEFWRAQWRTGANSERQQRGWKTLADRFGPGRAGWVAQATAPTNPQARPTAEVADGTELAPQPTFASIEPTEKRRTPVARLLPTRWTATAYAQGAVIAVGTGRPITSDPAVGPDLDAPLVQDEGEEVAAIDAGMNWLVDFTDAEELGMALRLRLSGPVDLLLVTGVRDTDAADGAKELAALLDAQRYSEGLGFLTPETRTNNAEGGTSGWSSAAAGSWAARPAEPAAGTNAALAGTAFGLDAGDVFGSLAAADAGEDAIAAAMSTVVWPASWGYWLQQFAGAGLDDTAWAADHARGFVRPAGPLPTLRVGRQPYGLLPVTSLGRFAGDEDENRLRRILTGLVDAAWRPAVGQAPRVGRGDVAADLVDVLRLGGRSDRVHLRRAYGARFAQSAQLFLGRRLAEAGFWDVARDRALPVAAAAGLGLLDGVLTVHEFGLAPVTLPLVSPTDDLGFLADLLAADPDELATRAEEEPPSLLAAIVRHGLLREQAAAAARLLAPEAARAADEEFYGFGEGALGWTAQRDQILPGGDTVRERLAASANPTGTDPAAASLAAYRAAVETVATAELPSIERHLLGTLDAAAYRLDAWVTSLAARRLADLRTAQPKGVVVGGYGWAEQLAPLAVTPVTDQPDDEPGPLLPAVDDPGYLHAPSLHQAQVAALLRNAHLANGAAADGPFAISLTSERVRLAGWIFDGVRAGRTVGAVLGYLVERDLHDHHLDASIDNAREVCPLPGEEELPVPARRLDGLRLHKLWSDSEDHALDHLVGNDQSDATRNGSRAVLRRLGVAVDAAADAIQAEQVHQFARGDLTRAVSSLADFDRGLVPPPSLDFVQTPRSGVGVTHRVGVLIDPDAQPAAGWGAAADSPRAAYEPGLDAWLGGLLGPATGRSITVRDAAADTGNAVPLPDLKLSASDLVRIAGAGDQGVAELAARAALMSPGDLLRPVLAIDPELQDLLELGRSLAALIGPAKPMDGAVLQPPHADPLPGTDLDELAQRAAAARTAVQQAVAALDDALSDTTRLEQLRSAVATTWDLAVGDSATPVENTPDGWTTAAVRARAQLSGRLAETEAADAPEGDPGRMSQLLRTLRTLLGPGSVALPRFVASTVADLVASRDDPGLGGDPLAAEVWLTRMERVREPLRQLGIALREAEALGGQPFRLGVAQVPHQPGARWNALPASSYVDAATSLVLTGAGLIEPGKELAGLLIDEWGEVVPSANETTGVAFRYDPPDLMAPQAILLAVPPVQGVPWTVGTLNQVLVETLEQAHLRAVPPAALGAVRQYLPATMLAYNTDGDAVSTNPNALTPAQEG